MTKPVIAVTAASGKTGQATARALLARGFCVRALVRQRDARADALAAAGAEIAIADMADAGSMVAALKGVQRAYYCPPITPHAAGGLLAFLHAVSANRLEAVVAMTQWLASPRHPTMMTRDMWAVERFLPKLSGCATTILNPGFFADNYLRVGIGMAAQLGIYANFVGQSENAPPSNDDMGRVAAAILADPAPHDGQRYRITGPEVIGVERITAALSRGLGRPIRAVDAPDWLLNKVAAYRGEPRYGMTVFRHYLVDHRQGAFAFGGTTDVVERVTGTPAESFETTVRGYAARPEARRAAGPFVAALRNFIVAPMVRGYNHPAYERQLDLPVIAGALYGMEDAAWKADRLAQLGGLPEAAARPARAAMPVAIA